SVHEPAEEAEASFALFFQLALEFDSEPAEGTDFCTCLKNGICAGDTKLYFIGTGNAFRPLLNMGI
ncbi:MAG: hypothetical protein II888_03315, partial [Clostridia bacterium]|nr:hypothetical protein [Clostridia bacterium]